MSGLKERSLHRTMETGPGGSCRPGEGPGRWPWRAGPAVPWAALAALSGCYLVVFVANYPCTHAIADEVGFINQAIVWSKGAVSAEGAGFKTLPDFIESRGRHVAWRNPGRSLVVLPFLILGGPRAIFLSGAVIHLLLTLVAGLTLARLGKSPLWAVLVLGHPTLALYSRTIMGDAPAGLCLLLALFALVAARRPGLWAGVAIGAAAVMRYQAGLVLPFVALAILATPSVPDRGRNALHCLLAGGAIGILIAGYNVFLYGSPIGVTNQGYFAVGFIPRNLAYYVPALLVVWPLMFLVPVVDPAPLRWVVRAVGWPFLAFLSAYNFHDRGPGWVQTLVLGQRLLQPALPVWIVGYAIFVDTTVLAAWRGRLPRRAVAVLAASGCAALVVAQAALFHAHQVHLRAMKSARDQVVAVVPRGSLVVGNMTLMKLFGVPGPDVPGYRWEEYDSQGQPVDHTAVLDAEPARWFLALLPKAPGDELPETLKAYIQRYQMTRIPTVHRGLILYEAPGRTGRRLEPCVPSDT